MLLGFHSQLELELAFSYAIGNSPSNLYKHRSWESVLVRWKVLSSKSDM